MKRTVGEICQRCKHLCWERIKKSKHKNQRFPFFVGFRIFFGAFSFSLKSQIRVFFKSRCFSSNWNWEFCKDDTGNSIHHLRKEGKQGFLSLFFFVYFKWKSKMVVAQCSNKKFTEKRDLQVKVF